MIAIVTIVLEEKQLLTFVVRSRTVVFGDKDECAGNVSVTLAGQGEEHTITTNTFGDLEFEGLEADKEFSVTIEHQAYAPIVLKVQTKRDIYLGDIILT